MSKSVYVVFLFCVMFCFVVSALTPVPFALLFVFLVLFSVLFRVSCLLALSFSIARPFLVVLCFPTALRRTFSLCASDLILSVCWPLF